MPKFDTMSAPEVGRYIAANLKMVQGALKVAYQGSRKKAPIHEIDSNLLPHSMYLFINAIKQQQKLVDGRQMHVKMDFFQKEFESVVPTFSTRKGMADFGLKEQRAAWIEQQAISNGRAKSSELPLSDARRTELMRQLYKQKQDGLYCMRSVHVDKEGWLPAVAIPAARNATQQAYFDYISSYTELPGNIQEKAKVGGSQMSAYVEYTAGQKDGEGEFTEPRWRVVYDWVNSRFFLTWHYQPGFFERADKKLIESPWVHIEHVAQQSGLEGPNTVPQAPDTSFKHHLMRRRGLTKVSWDST
jgi:hypothetical protein